MRCQFCHNPDTWDSAKGEEKSADELLSQALRYKTYWKDSGGITVSGGEPLLQLDFLLEFFTKAKAKGIHTVIDTAGQPFTRTEPFFSKFQELMKVTDLVMLDIKQIDEEAHKTLTGWSNANILDMARYLSDTGKAMWIRHVLVPGGSDRDDYLKRLDTFVKGLKTVEKIEVLPYHTLGAYKWQELHMDYPLEGVEPPTKERIENAKKLLHVEAYPVHEKDA
jgi:pyruvate formate lyase activating enzyme